MRLRQDHQVADLAIQYVNIASATDDIIALSAENIIATIAAAEGVVSCAKIY